MASKFHLEDRLKGLPDIIRNYNWELLIPEIGKVSKNAIEDDLIVRCKSVSIPERGVQKIESSFMGMKQYFPGMSNFGHTLAVTFEETSDLKVTSIFNDWANILFDIRSGSKSGGVGQVEKKRDATLDLYLRLYNYDGKILDKSIKVVNTFIENQDAIALDYTSNDSVKVNVTFSYDFWQWVPSV
jgi:hypothetical protein